MLIDSLLSDQEGAFLDALRHLILPAIVLGTIPLAVIARMTRSSMLEVLERGLCPHRPRQGPVALPRHRPPRAAQRADPGRHRDRPADRHADGRRRPDRDDLLLAGRRQMADRVDRPARLSRPPGRHPADLGRRHPRQSPRSTCSTASSIRGSAMPADVAAQRRPRQAPARPARSSSGDRFRENRGAVVGLAIVLAHLHRRGLRAAPRAAFARSSSSAASPSCRRSGTKAATWASRSAPTLSAATCSRASSMARASRCSSALR